jgi:hypothetical protein
MTQNGPGKMMAADIRTVGSAVQAGIPKPLFDTGYFNPGLGSHLSHYLVYAVSSDGERFLIPRPESVITAEAEPTPITVILNWTAGLNKK